jgi:hypothetical protein
MSDKKLTTTLRLMMVSEPKEIEIKWQSKEGVPMTRVRESLEAYLLGSELPLSVIDININKFSNGSQFRNVKLTDLYKMFVKNEDDLRTGKKIVLAEVELLPMKNNFSDNGTIDRFQPYLTKFDVALASESDLEEIALINKVTTDTSGVAEEETSVA